MNLYVFAFPMPVLCKMNSYFEGKRQHDFVVFFQIVSVRFDGGKGDDGVAFSLYPQSRLHLHRHLFLPWWG